MFSAKTCAFPLGYNNLSTQRFVRSSPISVSRNGMIRVNLLTNFVVNTDFPSNGWLLKSSSREYSQVMNPLALSFWPSQRFPKILACLLAPEFQLVISSTR
jgi:hypothetical protein